MTITLQEAEQALLRSGYLIESRLEKKLQSAGYYVDSNDAYPDSATGKSRELDLSAITARLVNRDRDLVFNVLLIECVNNPEPLALITKKPVIGFLFHEDLRVAGLPAKLLGVDGQWTPIQEALNLQKFHHYCASRIATQFCSFAKKSSQQQWMALHEGPHFDAFQKLCDAVDHRQDQHYKAWNFAQHEPMNLEFYYPVLVVQGALLEARPIGSSVALKAAQHLQFRRTVMRGSEAKTYQIDVVTEKYFAKFLSLVDGELETVVRRLKARRPMVQKSVARILAATKRLRSPNAIRRALEQV